MNLVGFSTPNNCGYIAEGQGGISKCYICGIDVQRLACQPSKLDVGVRIPYSAPRHGLGQPLVIRYLAMPTIKKIASNEYTQYSAESLNSLHSKSDKRVGTWRNTEKLAGSADNSSVDLVKCKDISNT